MGNDELDTYRQAVLARYHDWHSPLLAFVWRQGLFFRSGGAFMHGVQVVAYFSTIALLARAAMQSERKIAAWVVMLSSAVPIFWITLATVGSKDQVLLDLMLFVVALLATGLSRSTMILVALASAVAMLVRNNAIFAVYPVAVVLVWAALQERMPRRFALKMGASFAISALATLSLYLASAAVINGALNVRRTNVAMSLMVFDLAGMTKVTGRDEARGTLGDDFVAKVQQCYDPLLWDSFFGYGCKDVYDRTFGEGVGGEPGDDLKRRAVTSAWFTGVLSNPLAYLQHRLLFFAHATGVLPRPPWFNPIPSINFQNVNPAGDNLTFGPAAQVLDRAAQEMSQWVIIKPVVLMIYDFLLCLAALIWLRPSHFRLVGTLSLASGLCYALGFSVVGVSSFLRYFEWTMVATAIGTIFLASEAWKQYRNGTVAGAELLQWTQRSPSNRSS
jgi:hypothetical protein